MTKLKLKKKAKNLLIMIILAFIILFAGIIKGIDFYKQKQYEKTYEYKLINVGYSKEDANILEKKLTNNDLEYLLTIEENSDIISLVNDKYFIQTNFQKYLDFSKSNRDYNMRKVVEYVNIGRYNDFYENTSPTDIKKEELMLVNKYHYLKEDYIPIDLVTISQSYSWGEKGSQKCTKVTYDAFLELWNAANQEGYYLMVNSSYRDFAKQTSIFEDYKNRYGTEYAENYAAHPGYSEHQTGYALDIVDKNYTSKDSFTNSPSFNWLKDNAYKYGFILRYPSDKEDVTGTNFESWHYRYVGNEVAKYIYENNITFDEYYAYYLDK